MFEGAKNIGEPEAARRAFSLICLHQSAGRSAEPAYMALGSMSFGSLFNQVAAEVPQSKTSKVKVIAFVAGLTYYLCWFTLFGDCLMLDPERLEYTKGDPAFLLSHLHDHGSPGTRLGAYIKAMCGFVTSLPAKPSAAGARVGAINKLLPLMPPFFVCAATGHEQRNDSAMFEYMNANMALQQPSACVFAGFPPMTYGSVGMGPAAPSLAPLLNGDWGWTLEGVEALINEVYCVDSASPKELQRGGCMRLALHASFAAQIMHYKAREKAREVPAVTNILLRAVAARLERHSGGSSSSSAMVLTVVGGSAHSTLCAFGAAVRRNFDEANLLLTSRASHEGVERVVGVLGTALEAQRDAAKETTMLKVEVGELRTLLAQQGQMIEQQKRAMEALQKGAAWQQEALAQLLAGQRHLAGGGGGGEGTAAAAAATLVDAHASALAPSFPVAPPSAPRPPPPGSTAFDVPARQCHHRQLPQQQQGQGASRPRRLPHGDVGQGVLRGAYGSWGQPAAPVCPTWHSLQANLFVVRAHGHEGRARVASPPSRESGGGYARYFGGSAVALDEAPRPRGSAARQPLSSRRHVPQEPEDHPTEVLFD